MKSTIEKLLTLIDIFEDGYTIKLSGGKLKMYNEERRYVVSYRTIAVIEDEILRLHMSSWDLPKNAVIGYWKDDKGTKWLELNKVFYNWEYALICAKQHKQRFIYDLKTNKTIEVGQ